MHNIIWLFSHNLTKFYSFTGGTGVYKSWKANKKAHQIGLSTCAVCPVVLPVEKCYRRANWSQNAD